MDSRDYEMIRLAAQAIYDKKGQNILGIDVKGISSLTDAFLIAEGSVPQHVKALADEISRRVEKTYQLTPIHVDGLQEGDWIVLDFGDLMIHLFVPELRQHYALEELWHEGRIVDLRIQIPEQAES